MGILERKERQDLAQCLKAYGYSLETVNENSVAIIAKLQEALDILDAIADLHYGFRGVLYRRSNEADRAFWAAIGAVLDGAQ